VLDLYEYLKFKYKVIIKQIYLNKMILLILRSIEINNCTVILKSINTFNSLYTWVCLFNS